MCVRYLRFSKILKLILFSLLINLIFSSVCLGVSVENTSFNGDTFDMFEMLLSRLLGTDDIYNSIYWYNGQTDLDRLDSSLNFLLQCDYAGFTERSSSNKGIFVVGSKQNDVNYSFNNSHSQLYLSAIKPAIKFSITPMAR